MGNFVLTLNGCCECGGVSFTAKNVRDAVNICHCSQCRRSSGHLWGATRAEIEDIEFHSQDTLTWYASSDTARRGFCNHCGSRLFFHTNGTDSKGIAAGSIEGPNGLVFGQHIFVKDKGGYYDIPDHEHQKEAY